MHDPVLLGSFSFVIHGHNCITRASGDATSHAGGQVHATLARTASVVMLRVTTWHALLWSVLTNTRIARRPRGTFIATWRRMGWFQEVPFWTRGLGVTCVLALVAAVE